MGSTQNRSGLSIDLDTTSFLRKKKNEKEENLKITNSNTNKCCVPPTGTGPSDSPVIQFKDKANADVSLILGTAATLFRKKG